MRLRTPRLVVRDLAAADLDDVHRILDLDLQMDDQSRELRACWVDWTVLDYEFRRRAHQPGYGEYGVALRDTDELVGLVGLVPALMPFGLLPAHGGRGALAVPEVGVFWAVATEHQRRGYAAEAAPGADRLRLHRVERRPAGGDHRSRQRRLGRGDALARRDGGRAQRGRAVYLQVVGWLDNPDREPDWPSG